MRVGSVINTKPGLPGTGRAVDKSDVGAGVGCEVATDGCGGVVGALLARVDCTLVRGDGDGRDPVAVRGGVEVADRVVVPGAIGRPGVTTSETPLGLV